jgi:hypothetical protein
MQQPNIAQQIEQLIASQTQAAPGIVKGYESALSNAAQQDQQSIDSLRGLYSAPSKFEKSKLGAFGLGLMAPTKSGNFGEGMYNAFSGAMEAADYNREQNLSREEKLAKLAALQAQLTRQQANDQMSVFDKQSGMIGVMQGNEKTMADLNLRGAQYGPRELAPGEFGPEAPGSDYISKAKALMSDYYANPQNYAGAQGQAMVSNAQSILNNFQNNQRMRDIASQKAATKPTLTSRDKMMLDDAITQNNSLKQTLVNLEEAEQLGPKTWSGIMPNQRARIASWWAGNEGQDDTTADEHLRYQQIMEGEAIKQMSETLKGATTDREMLKFIDIIADPSVPWNSTKKHALAQVKRFAQSVVAMNEEKIRGIRDGSYWTGEPSSAQPGVSDMDPSTVLGEDAQGNVITWDDILTTARENGMTPEEVLERLQQGQ